MVKDANFPGIITNVYNGPKHGKIIMWQGGADKKSTRQDSIEIYREVATLFGGGTTDFAGTAVLVPLLPRPRRWALRQRRGSQSYCRHLARRTDADFRRSGELGRERRRPAVGRRLDAHGHPCHWAGQLRHASQSVRGRQPQSTPAPAPPPWPVTTLAVETWTPMSPCFVRRSTRWTVRKSSNSLDYAAQGLTAAQCPNP